jgi:hypothetical protein
MCPRNKGMWGMQGLVFLLGLVALLPAQGNAAQISISRPANGTVYHPGDTVTVQVNNPAGDTLWFGGQPHLDENDVVTKEGPYVHTFKIPTDIPAAGDQTVSVVDLSTPDKFAARVTIHIEPQVSADATLSSQRTSLHFKFPGLTQTVPLEASQDGPSGIDVSASNQLQASVANPQVASVNGVSVTALSRGSTTVTFSLGGASITFPVIVDKGSGVRGDLTGNGIVDLDDLAVIQSALNTKVVAPNDPRDLNGDGKIDALDARILVTLCTRSGCK